MVKIAHISDLHFGPYFLQDVADDLVHRIRQSDVDLIVVSGDLTHRARAREFAACDHYLQRLGDLPIMLVPGNHDIPLYHLWDRFRQPTRRFQRHLGHYPSSYQYPTAAFVGLNSVDPYRSVVNGRVSSDELASCAERFETLTCVCPEKFWRVVVLHHHLLPPPGWDRRRPMPKAKRLLERLDAMQVDVVLSGHLHRAYVGNTLDVYAGEQRSDGIIVVQCGTSTSRRGRGYEKEKNSFNIVTLTDHLEVEHWMYFSDSDRDAGFQRVSAHKFEIDP